MPDRLTESRMLNALYRFLPQDMHAETFWHRSDVTTVRKLKEWALDKISSTEHLYTKSNAKLILVTSLSEEDDEDLKQ